jgi:hypothetical protein
MSRARVGPSAEHPGNTHCHGIMPDASNHLVKSSFSQIHSSHRNRRLVFLLVFFFWSSGTPQPQAVGTACSFNQPASIHKSMHGLKASSSTAMQVSSTAAMHMLFCGMSNGWVIITRDFDCTSKTSPCSSSFYHRSLHYMFSPPLFSIPTCPQLVFLDMYIFKSDTSRIRGLPKLYQASRTTVTVIVVFVFVSLLFLPPSFFSQ